MDVTDLRRRVEGKVTASTDAVYDDLRRKLVWNRRTPLRYPRLIVQVATEQDVIESVRFAGEHGMKVSVRGGGHSWVGFSLRDDSVLIDLGQLQRCSIDPETRRATVQPAVTGRVLNNHLQAHGLAFPVGHCPSVPLSGYLLNGGLGWNSNRWGPACFSIETASVITADGNLLVADDEHQPDLLWAIRGGGPGFFAIVTQYRLKVYEAPRAIMTSTSVYDLEDVEEVGSWAMGAALELPNDAELTLFIAPAPPSLAGRCRSANGFVCILSATAFLDTERQAIAALNILERCPVAPRCLAKNVNQPASFDSLLNLGSTLWPEGHRYMAEALWSDSPPRQPLAIAREHFLRAPSLKSLALCAFSTGSRGGRAVLPDAAFSMTAQTLLLCYAVWERADDDEANASWHRGMVAALDQFAVGHYVGESDIVSTPARAERSFAWVNWRRLQSLRRIYDPGDRFHRDFTS